MRQLHLTASAWSRDRLDACTACAEACSACAAACLREDGPKPMVR